jgi:hypothetical protein
MDIQYSADYYWKDITGKRVAFNEFEYPDFASAVSALDTLKKRKGGLYAVDTIYEDIKTLRGQYLIDNIENAFKEWKASVAGNIPFNDFCEYILPYRATVEPVQNWRSAYNAKYKWISDSLKDKPFETVLAYAGIDYKDWFTFTYGKEVRYEPLPRLGPMHLLFRKKGACEDVAALEVFSFRSQGIPVSYNIIPLWGTSVGAHFLNTAFDPKMKPVRLDVTTPEVVNHELPREPAKVIRLTYSKQPGTLAAFEKEENIPPGFLQTVNYIDITNEYWPTAAISFDLFPDSRAPAIVYACMFSGGVWQPIWWGKAGNDSVKFTSMPRGTVILPAYYIHGSLKPAGFPKVNGFNNELLLKPDSANKRTVTIVEQERYLIFRPGKKYQLYYWDNDWKSVGTQTAADNAKELVFENVPKNALLLLIPEYSEGKERPFIITDDNKRYWW